MLNDRKLTLVLLLTVALACTGVALAKKPVKPPPEPPPPTPEGTIYFRYFSDIVGMDGDGNKFVDHPAPVPLNGYSANDPEPSSLDYGGYRWWLTILWDDTISAHEVYAYRPVTLPDDTVDLEWVQLTDISQQIGLWGGIARWSDDGQDTYVTFMGWDMETELFNIFRLNVSAAALDAIGSAIPPARLEHVTTLVTTELAIGSYAISPPAQNQVAYAAGDSIWMEDIGGTATAVFPGARGLDWAPDGSKIACRYDDAIWTVNPDGSDATCVADLGRHDVGEAYSAPFWSPDSSQLVFRELGTGKRNRTTYQVHRMPAEGGTIINLTGDLDKYTSKLPLGWRPN